MPRILRNYLISFVIIGLFFLAVHIINKLIEPAVEEAREPSAPSVETSR